MSSSQSYLKNLGKSILFSSVKAVGKQMPMLSKTYESNKHALSSGVQYTKTFFMTPGATFETIENMAKKYTKDIEEIKNNAFSDLKSGKFVNFDRQASDHMDDSGFDSGFDMSWGDDDGEMDVEMSFGDSVKVATKVTEEGNNMRTKAIMSTIAKSSEESTNFLASSNKKLQFLSMNMQSKMHTETMKMMSDSTALLTNMVEFQNNQITEHMNKQLAFYDNVLTELREIKENQKNSMNTPKAGSKRTDRGNVLGADGDFNLAEYGKLIKKNFKNYIDSTPVGLALSMQKMASSMGGGSMIDKIKESPLSFATDLMISGLMPKSMKVAMNGLDKSFSGLFSTLALKLNAAKKDISGSPVKTFLATVLGIDLPNGRNINVGGYHKEAMAYNGRADKAITEVIPTLLSNILSAVNGSNKIALYDYKTGKFVDSKGIVDTTKKNVRDSKLSEMSDIKSQLAKRLSKIPGGKSELMQDELETFLLHLIDSDTPFNPLKQKSKPSSMNLKNNNSYNAIRAAFLSLPKGEQNRLANYIINARHAGLNRVEMAEEELFESGLSAAYSGLDEIHGKDSSTPSSKKSRKKNRSQKSTNGGSTSSNPISGNHPTSVVNLPVETMVAMMQAFDETDEQTNGILNNKFIKKLIGDNPEANKALTNFQKLKKRLSPANMINKFVTKVDSMIYRVIYGKDATDEDGNPKPDATGKVKPNTFIGRMTMGINRGIDSSIGALTKKLIDPLSDKLFGEEGLMTKFTVLFEPFLTKMKEFARTGWYKVKDFLYGNKNADGFYTGGFLSDTANAGLDFNNTVRHFFTGKGYFNSQGVRIDENKDTSVFAYIKSYSKSIMGIVADGLLGAKETVTDPVTGEITSKRNGQGLFTPVVDQLKGFASYMGSLFKTKDGETSDDMSKTAALWKKEIKESLPKVAAGGLMGAIASAVLPGGPMAWAVIGSSIAFANNSNQFRNFLFGKDGEGGILPQWQKNVLDKIKTNLPNITAGGLIGLGAGALLPGIPATALLPLGAALGYAKTSERSREFLFGKTDKDGNLLKKGLVPQPIIDSVKKFYPKTMAGAIIGAALGIGLPGISMVPMMFMGSAVGFASSSDKVKEALFGKTDKDGNLIKKGLLPKRFVNSMDKILPAGLRGAAVGGILGLMGGPFGVLGGIVMGSGFGMLSVSDKFRESILGKEDENGKRKGGLVGLLRTGFDKALIKPLKSLGNWALDFKRTKREGGLIPVLFKSLWTSLKDDIVVPLGKLILGGFKLVFGKGPIGNFLRGFGETMAHSLLGPLKGLGIALGASLFAAFQPAKILGRFLFGYKVDKDANSPDNTGSATGRYFKGLLGLTEPYKRARAIKNDKGGKNDDHEPPKSNTKEKSKSEDKKKSSEEKTKTKWKLVRQLTRRTGLASQSTPVEARINNLTKMVSDVQSDEQYRHAHLSLLHDIAVSTATGVSANRKENNMPNLLSMLPGVLGGLSLAITGLGANIMSILTGQDYSGTGLARAVNKLLEKLNPNNKNTPDANSKTVKETAEEVAEKTAKAAAGNVSGGSVTTASKIANSKIGKKVTTTVKDISDKIIKLLKNSAVLKAFGDTAATIKKYTPKVAKTIAEYIMKTAPKAASKSMRYLAGPYSAVAFAVYDLITGSTLEVRYIAQVPPDADVTMGMRATAGLSKFLSGMLFGLISELTIFNLLYPFIGKEKNVDKWKSDQAKLKEGFQNYNGSHDKNKTFDQYNRMMNPTTFDHAKGFFSSSSNGVNAHASQGAPWYSSQYQTRSNTGFMAIQGGMPALQSMKVAGPTPYMPGTKLLYGIGGGNPEFYDTFSNKNPQAAAAQRNIKATTSKVQGPSQTNKTIKPLVTSGLGGKTDDQLRKEYAYVFKFKNGDMTVQDLRRIEERCAAYGISPHLWLAVVEKESGYRSYAKNSGGSASGWGQIIKSTAAGLYKIVFKKNDYNHETMGFDKQINSELSIYYLSTLVKKLGIKNGLAGYNQGGGGYYKAAGQRYAEDVLKRIRNNTKIDPNTMVFNGNGKPLQYDPSLASGAPASNTLTGSGTSFATMIAGLGTSLTGVASKLLGGFDLTTLGSVFTNYANWADPFYTPGSTDTTSAPAGPSQYAGQPLLYGNDSEKSKQLIAAHKTKYPRLTGDADMHSFIAARLNKLGNDLGVDVKINSGYRSSAEQQRLVDEWRAKNPGKSEKERRQWVADPGKGTHEVGLAADVGTKKIQAMNNSQLAKYGLYKPMSYENWHIEPIETRDIVRSNSVAQLTPIYGLPYAPNNYQSHLNPNYPMGGGDPSYYDNTSNVDSLITQLSETTAADKYVNRVDNMKTLAKATEAHDSIMTEYLKVIADGIMQLVGIASDTKAVLETIASKSAGVVSSAPRTQPIVVPVPQSSGNQFTDSSKKVDKGLAISAIAKGTM